MTKRAKHRGNGNPIKEATRQTLHLAELACNAPVQRPRPAVGPTRLPDPGLAPMLVEEAAVLEADDLRIERQGEEAAREMAALRLNGTDPEYVRAVAEQMRARATTLQAQRASHEQEIDAARRARARLPQGPDMREFYRTTFGEELPPAPRAPEPPEPPAEPHRPTPLEIDEMNQGHLAKILETL